MIPSLLLKVNPHKPVSKASQLAKFTKLILKGELKLDHLKFKNKKIDYFKI